MKFLFVFLFLLSNNLFSSELNPLNNSEILVLSSGQDLKNFKVENTSLSVTHGIGENFTAKEHQQYLAIINYAKTKNAKLQYKFIELDTGKIIEQSANPEKVFFGASVSKIFVAASVLEFKNSSLDNKNLTEMAKMLVVSDNNSWKYLQKYLGDGDNSLGQERNWNFTRQLGLERTRGFQGWFGEVHGNELLVDELIEFISKVYQQDFVGAHDLWKIMYTCRTGTTKSLKYLPKSLPVGGKTGTYKGPTFDPETGAEIVVDVHNHLIYYFHAGRPYALAILTDGPIPGGNTTKGDDEHVALMAGGLFYDLTFEK